MRLKNYFFGLLAGALLVGCTAGRTTSFNLLKVGMKKPEVILIMGEPDAIKTGQGFEYIIYKFMGPRGVSECVVAAFTPIPGLVPFICKQNQHFIKLEGHIVKSYGRVMDIDNETDPNARVLTDWVMFVDPWGITPDYFGKAVFQGDIKTPPSTT